MDLAQYCAICGERIDKQYHFRQIGFRGKGGDTPANLCNACSYGNSFSYARRLRFVVTKERRWLADLGYYICAKPCDASEEEWQDVDRCWIEVDRVYETRWDCRIEPDGVRQIRKAG